MKQRSSENIANQPLLCYVCGYSTSTTSRSYYKTHMNIHKGIKPYRSVPVYQLCSHILLPSSVQLDNSRSVVYDSKQLLQTLSVGRITSNSLTMPLGTK